MAGKGLGELSQPCGIEFAPLGTGKIFTQGRVLPQQLFYQGLEFGEGRGFGEERFFFRGKVPADFQVEHGADLRLQSIEVGGARRQRAVNLHAQRERVLVLVGERDQVAVAQHGCAASRLCRILVCPVSGQRAGRLHGCYRRTHTLDELRGRHFRHLAAHRGDHSHDGRRRTQTPLRLHAQGRAQLRFRAAATGKGREVVGEVRCVAVIGAGIMGRGIAHVAALGGYRTILEDILPAALRRAESEIRSNLDKAVELGKVAAPEAQAALGRLEFAQSVEEAARQADLVIEAVPEELESKIEIFTLLDKVCRPGTILATNTSSLSITEIASVTYRAPKCVGMHFFNPVHKMKLLEIVRALETDDETLAATVDVGKHMRKEVVVIKESPGFITSRINAMIGNEAFYMLQEGIASASDIDKALKLGLNHPMGPFELVDLVGLDTRLSILEYLHKSLGEKYRPAPLLVQYVKAGRLGRKSGRGVYAYPESAGSRSS